MQWERKAKKKRTDEPKFLLQPLVLQRVASDGFDPTLGNEPDSGTKPEFDHMEELQTHTGQIKATTYAFDNRGDAPGVVYLEHPREAADWRIVEPATAHEITESFWRFRFDLAPRGLTQFRVRTQRLLSQRLS